MKLRFLTVLSLFLLALGAMAEGRAKYVFLFIGDGMGVNQVNATEMFLGAKDGKIGNSPLCFGNFPYTAFVTSFSASNYVTDSAAAGTAIATGKKTKNGTLGMEKDQTTPANSMAVWAQQSGAAVGITTSVSIDHATPAAFYAHVPNRGDAYRIGQQLTQSNMDFFASSDFVSPKNPDGGDNLYQQAEKNGYTIVRSYKEYQKKSKKAEKMILFQTEEASRRKRSGLLYARDQKEGDLTLTDITRAATNFLTKKQKEKDGFFLMVEGGEIDHLCHANDPAFIYDVIDMDNAVKVAYEFYQQHPDETLIVVTADHETGGLSLGRGSSNIYPTVISHQKMSISQLGNELKELHKKHGEAYNWDVVKAFLTENFGFWDTVKVNDDQTKTLKNAFDRVMAGKGKDSKSLYQNDGEMAWTVRNVINECARLGWAHGGHSNGYVPCFAIGAGAELFTGRFDNTDISKKIAKAAGWEVK